MGCMIWRLWSVYRGSSKKSFVLFPFISGKRGVVGGPFHIPTSETKWKASCRSVVSEADTYFLTSAIEAVWLGMPRFNRTSDS